MKLSPRLRRVAGGSLLGLSLFALVVGFSRLAAPSTRLVELRARVAEAGGWAPGSIAVRAGQPVRFRLVSDDMEHGFAIGQVDLVAASLAPGLAVEVDVTFDRPGRYVFYCTKWCGAGHWRMRGVIEVAGRRPDDAMPPPPAYVRLGLDIDAPHPARVIPEMRPSAVRGAHLGASLPPEFLDREYYRTHRPDEAWQSLRAAPELKELTDQQVWDALAFAWRSATTPAALSTGQRLYDENCAACHGATGGGDGAMAGLLGASQHSALGSGAMTPTSFAYTYTEPAPMLGASPALLHGKIIRGGMGTGMPYWGPIFTDDQTWAIVDYLWSFQFEYQEMP